MSSVSPNTTSTDPKKIFLFPVNGDIDQELGARLKKEVIDLAQQGERRIVLDLKKVQAVHSAGLGYLLLCVSLANRLGTQVRLCQTQAPVAQLIHLAGLADVLKVFPDEKSVKWD